MYNANVLSYVLFVIMDPFEETTSKTPMRFDCDNDKNTNCKVTPRQCGANDDNESVFTSMSSQANSSYSVQNGPRLRNVHSLSSNESGQSSRLSENNSDYFRNSGSECNKVNSSCTCTEQGDISRSKSDSVTCENCVEVSPEIHSCQRHKVCMDRVGINHNLPSTSGSSKSVEVTENSYSFKENRKRPSSLKLNRPNLDDDSSSDTGNDDYSLGSEDGCIYTYRGGEHLADLPSSFFSLDMGLPLDNHLPIPPNYPAGQQGAANAARDRNSRASSPDMDFLEMDFDPGPSCEVDTGDESTPDAELDAASNMPEENEPVLMMGVSPEFAEARLNPPIVSATLDASICFDVPSTSRGVTLAQGDIAEEPRTNYVFYGPYITHVNARGEQILVRRTMCHWPHNAPVSLHISSGDLVSPREMSNYEEDPERPFAHQINQGERPTFDSANLSSALYHLTMAKRLMVEKTRSDLENYDSINVAGDAPAACSSVNCGTSCAETPRSMVWSEREACERQVTQIATSACGATAIVNVFIALGVPVNIEKINSAVNTRQRANNAPLPRYLLSRAVAGCTAADLVNGIQRASDGLVTARFFPTYPERAMSLSHWLADWISLGAVPILTLNLQVGCDGEIPDAWHHQMVFGVSPRGVYLCNPVECVRETALWPRLTSPSVLLVRARDVVSRFTATTDLTPLMAVPDRRFHTFNVLGQVVNVIREWRASRWSEAGTRTRHVRLPAAYQAGVAVAALTGSEAHRRLSLAAQLPILAPQIDPDK